MRAIGSILAIGVVMACASADVLVLDPTPRPERLADSVLVLLEEPSQSYQTIAFIEVSDDGWDLSMESLAKKMRKEAAKLGGDAVIVGTQAAEAGAVIVPVGDMLIAAAVGEKKLVGKVVVFAAPIRN
jgi:hypothetical protein